MGQCDHSHFRDEKTELLGNGRARTETQALNHIILGLLGVLLERNLSFSQEGSDPWRLASVPRLNQPFPRWGPGEALAEIAAWGIFLALSPEDGSGYAITRALVPSRPGPVLPGPRALESAV